jgi:hypothetical protein
VTAANKVLLRTPWKDSGDNVGCCREDSYLETDILLPIRISIEISIQKVMESTTYDIIDTQFLKNDKVKRGNYLKKGYSYHFNNVSSNIFQIKHVCQK